MIHLAMKPEFKFAPGFDHRFRDENVTGSSSDSLVDSIQPSNPKNIRNLSCESKTGARQSGQGVADDDEDLALAETVRPCPGPQLEETGDRVR